MEAHKIKQSLKQAIADLEKAENELNRPQEDVVPLCVCISARHSMNALMRLYLVGKHVAPAEDSSLYSLFEKCRQYETACNSLDLETIKCNKINQHECENRYCISVENLTNCITVAKQIEALMLKSMHEEETKAMN